MNKQALEWLILMLDKAGGTPRARLLALFDVLSDWSRLPNNSLRHDVDVVASEHDPLLIYLTEQARLAGTALPDMLAMQIYMMAATALHAPDAQACTHQLTHAKRAAEALIAAQTNKTSRVKKISAYALAASSVGAMVLAGFLYGQSAHEPALVSAQTNSPLVTAQVPNDALIASPAQTAALVAEIEQMRKGSCQLIEAIQLPDSYKKVYFENIVLGQISTVPSEQKLVRELLQKVRCNYTPMLMANSTG